MRMSMHTIYRRCFLLGIGLFTLIGLTACAPSVEIPETLKGSETELLAQANAYYEQGEYEKALGHFLYIKDHFIRSDSAGITRFYAGECYFALKQYEDAAAEYISFLTFFPNDPMAAEAQYKLGVCRFQEALGPERDQTDINEALTELQTVLENYPENQAVVEKTQAKIREVHDKLAEHEYLVARFYRIEKRYESSNARLHYLIERFPESAFLADALLMLGENYLKLDQAEQAKDAFSRMAQQFPSHKETEKARKHLEELGVTNISLPVSQPSEPTPASEKSAVTPPSQVVREGYVVLKRDQQISINLTRSDGIQSGMMLDVYRGDQLVGKIRVTDVQEGFSLGEIDSLTPGMSIEEDDRVVAQP